MLASLLLTFPSIYHHILPCILSAASRHWAGTFTHSLSHLLTHSLPLFLRVCLYLLSVRAFCLPYLGVRRKGPEVGQVASVSLTKLDTKVCSLTFLFLSLSLTPFIFTRSDFYADIYFFLLSMHSPPLVDIGLKERFQRGICNSAKALQKAFVLTCMSQFPGPVLYTMFLFERWCLCCLWS